MTVQAKAAARTLQAAEHLGSLACNQQKLEEAREASPHPHGHRGAGPGGHPDCRLPGSGNAGQYSPVVSSHLLILHKLTEQLLYAHAVLGPGDTSGGPEAGEWAGAGRHRHGEAGTGGREGEDPPLQDGQSLRACEVGPLGQASTALLPDMTPDGREQQTRRLLLTPQSGAVVGAPRLCGWHGLELGCP